MLIIPAIKIHNRLCRFIPVGEDGTEEQYPRDPVSIARVWRGENAKALHVIDIDGAAEGRSVNADLVAELTRAVDIPVQLAGGLRTLESVRFAFEELAVYRVVLTSAVIDDPDLIGRLIELYGPRKIVPGIDLRNGKIVTGGRKIVHELDPLEIARRIRKSGAERLIVSPLDERFREDGPPIAELLALANESGLKITLNGAVYNYGQLRNVQEANPRIIDSLVLDEPLYNNAFPCQKVWRTAEKNLIEQNKLI